MNTMTTTRRSRPDDMVTGVLIYNGRCRLVTIEKSRMIFDFEAYCAHVAAYMEDWAARCRDWQDATEYIRDAQALRDWVNGPRTSVPPFEFLAPRALLRPHTIRRANLDDYLSKVTSAASVEPSKQVLWMLNADLSIPELYVHVMIRELAWFTGPDILGFSLNQKRIGEVTNKHLRRLGMDSGDWRLGNGGEPPLE